jgi:hypothetical protein
MGLCLGTWAGPRGGRRFQISKVTLYSELSGNKICQEGTLGVWKIQNSMECGACLGSALRVEINLLSMVEAVFITGTGVAGVPRL